MRTKNTRGFTLIEVMISITILASLMVLAARTFQSATESKRKIQTNLDQVSPVRDALKIIETDINRAFHYRDIEKEIKAAIKKGKTSPSPTPKPNPDPSAPATPVVADPPKTPEEEAIEAARVDPTTFFEGTDVRMDFVTLNTERILKDKAQADFVEVVYYLEKCRSTSGETSSTCLFRKIIYLVGPKPAEEILGQKQILLENVSEFKLRYIGEGKEDWNSEWKTGEAGDAVTKGRFPDAVEVSLTVLPDPKDTKRKISTQIVAPIRFPNNPPPKSSQ